LSPASRSRGGVIAVVLGVIITLGVSCNGFREDEVECEQAVNRLKECCPNFVAQQLDCSYSERLDCSDNVTGRQYPALSLDESRCVQSGACADLVANGVCERAQKARPTVTGSSSSNPTSAPTQAVCR
jgi:hypothetical protein